MNILEIISKFINSWYFVVIIVLVIFLFITKKSWNIVVKEISLEKIFLRIVSIFKKNQEQKKLLSKEDISKFKKLIEDMNAKSYDDFYFRLSTYVQASEQTKEQIKEMEKKNEELFKLWQYYMFSYFNMLLVPNSKQILHWFYNNRLTTKEVFINYFFQNTNVLINLRSQKEIILNVLLQNSLILKDNRDLFYVSNLGTDFLKFIFLIR